MRRAKRSDISRARRLRTLGAAVAATALALASAVAPGSALGASTMTSPAALENATRALALTAGPEGDLWFAGYRGAYSFDALPGPPPSGIVGKVTPTGELTTFASGVEATATGIAAGSDGALWVIQGKAPEIARVTTTGQFTYFPLPSPATAPTSIVAGPDGAIWFTESASDQIGRITAAGAVSEFPLPGGSEPGKVIAGDEGDLWVLAPGTDSIDRVEADSGAVTSYPIGGGAKGAPVDLTLGPEGKVFFTEEASRIGRLAPATGKVTQLPLHHPGRLITAGPGGDLWFTAATRPGLEGPQSNGIASITPTGHHLTFAACTDECDANPAALTAGPDGALWFSTETRFVYGGGASGLMAATEPGFVSSYLPAPPALKVKSGALALGKAAKLDIVCRRGAAGDRCKGRLTLKAPAALGGFRIGSVGFNLYSGEIGTVRMRLSREARQILRHRKLKATASSNFSLAGSSRPKVLLVGEAAP